MAFIRKNMVLVLVIVACAVGFFVYQNYFSGGEKELLVSSTPMDLGSEELLTSLSSLKAVRLEASLFSDPIFLSLVDFGINIPPQPVGRPNPFAPLGVSASQSTNTRVPATTIRTGP
jgi:hypothetical protein